MKSTRSDWLIPASLIAMSLVPAIAGSVRLAQLAGGAAITPENARFFAATLPVVLHVPAAIVYKDDWSFTHQRSATMSTMLGAHAHV